MVNFRRESAPKVVNRKAATLNLAEEFQHFSQLNLWNRLHKIEQCGVSSLGKEQLSIKQTKICEAER